MFKKTRQWFMHKTNPLHFFSGIVALLYWYDRAWSGFFGVKRITKKQIVEFITKNRMQRIAGIGFRHFGTSTGLSIGDGNRLVTGSIFDFAYVLA